MPLPKPMTDEEYLRKWPWVVVAMFLHERYGDCMEDRTAAELEARLAKYGHRIVSDAASPAKRSLIRRLMNAGSTQPMG